MSSYALRPTHARHHLAPRLAIAALTVLGLMAAPARTDAQSPAKCRLTDLKCLRDAAAASVGGRVAGCPKNDTFQCAKPLALDTRLNGAVGQNNAKLYYKLEIATPGVLRVALGPMPNRTDVHLTLADRKYDEVGSLGFAAGQPGEQLLQVASAGTYYLLITPRYGVPDEAFSLLLTSTPTGTMGDAGATTGATTGAPTGVADAAGAVGTPPSGCALNDTYQCATPAAVGRPIVGIIGRNRGEVYYRLEIASPSVLRFAMRPTPASTDVYLALVDARYRDVGTLGWGAGQPGEQPLQVASAGTYYVRMTPRNAVPDEQFTLLVSRTATGTAAAATATAAPQASATGASASAATALAEGDVVVPKIDGVRLLTRPADGARVAGTVKKSEELVYLGEERGGFLKVQGAAAEGWVKRTMVAKR